ncbi:MBL fold metallo-hydrolase [Nocardioides donggukensis]|uniref:MBL fold metallo-hydrolase n=1 Tax=Nocardioides donggukensis TaxID=2774019 RepID=A0A927Q1K2_9ACTN|nr:MBL fold metallo-hydrolase [Nocardioides donggukensis]MBD8868816.1 MBL fold metallo-hydrolase [Nocardioides donggukensis]
MRVTIVGCSGSYPGPHSPASCYLVEAEGVDEAGEPRTWRILLDLGSGAIGTLHRFADPLAIDGVFLSHLHADHCLDLCGYYVLRKYHPTGHQPRIPVWGPDGTAERMARSYDLPPSPGMTEEFDFRTYPAGPGAMVEFGPFRVEAVPVVHPVPAYSLRVEAAGRLLVYTGDCGPCDGLERAAQGADLLLAEAAFCEGEDNPEDLHLTGRDVGELAVKAGADRLVLTHVPPWHDPEVAYDEARAVWDGPLALARTGDVHEV